MHEFGPAADKWTGRIAFDGNGAAAMRTAFVETSMRPSKTAMRVMVYGFVVCAVLAIGARSAAAQSSVAGVAVKIGTLGYGFDVAVPVGERLNARGGASFFTWNHDFDTDGINLAAQLRLRSVSASLDWFPFAGGFHVSPGVMLYNGNEVNATATVPAGRRFSLGNDDYVSNAASPVSGNLNVAFKRVAPSLVVGWGNIVPRGDRRWSIPVELGVVYSRAPTGVLTLGGSACAVNGSNCRSIASDPTLQSNLAREQSDLNNDLDVLKIIPVISFGFSYKF